MTDTNIQALRAKADLERERLEAELADLEDENESLASNLSNARVGARLTGNAAEVDILEAKLQAGRKRASELRDTINGIRGYVEQAEKNATAAAALAALKAKVFPAARQAATAAHTVEKCALLLGAALAELLEANRAAVNAHQGTELAGPGLFASQSPAAIRDHVWALICFAAAEALPVAQPPQVDATSGAMYLQWVGRDLNPGGKPGTPLLARRFASVWLRPLIEAGCTDLADKLREAIQAGATTSPVSKPSKKAAA